jgi:hypothetical protein
VINVAGPSGKSKVDRHEVGLAVVHERVQLLRPLARTGHDVRAFGRQCPGDRQPDPLARTGDDGDGLRQTEVHVSVPLSLWPGQDGVGSSRQP